MAAAPGWSLLSQLSPERWRWAGVAALLVASVLGEVAVPYFCGRVTDWVAAKDELAAALPLLLLGLASAGTEFCCDVCFGGTLGRALGRLQREAFAALLRRPGTAPPPGTAPEPGTAPPPGTAPEPGTAPPPGTAPEPPPAALTGDLEAAHQALAEALSALLWYLVRGIGLLGTLAWLCPPLALGTLLALPALLLLPRALGRVQQRLARQVQEALADATKVAVETFQAMGTVRSFAYEAGATRRYQGCLGHLCQLEAKEAATYAANLWASGLVAVALKLGLLCYGGHLVASGDISPGDLLTALIYQMQFTEAVEVVLRYFPSLAKAVGASEKVLELLAQEQQGPGAPEGTLAPEVLQGHLQLQDVWFSYPGQQEAVLRGVSLELRPGEVVAVVAPQGAGKSTLAALALGLRAPTAGRVLLDGHPLAAYQHRYLRSQVSLVPQDPRLLCRSLLSNLRYGRGRCSLEQLDAACRRAGADRCIASLPHGYRTQVGELGGQLSGGQRQLVALARALLRDPKVLVLDEPSSALDAGSRQQVEQELFGGGGAGRAVLLLTAQLALAARAQRVAVLEGGRLRPLGGSPRDLLLPLAGRDRQLLRGGGGQGEEGAAGEGLERGTQSRGDGRGRGGDSKDSDGDSEDKDGDSRGREGDSKDRAGDTEGWDGDPKDRAGVTEGWAGDPKDRAGDPKDRAEDTKGWDRDPKDRAGDTKGWDGDPKDRAEDTESWDGDPKDRAGDPKDRAGDTEGWDGDPKDRAGVTEGWAGDPKDRAGDPKDRAEDTKGWDRDPKDRAGDTKGWDGDPKDRAEDTESWDGDPKDRAGDPKDRAGDTEGWDGDPKDRAGVTEGWAGDPKDRAGDPKDRAEDTKGWDRDPKDRAGDTKGWDGDPKDRAEDTESWDGDPKDRAGDPKDRAGDTESWDGDPKDRAGAIRSRARATRSQAETTGSCGKGP